MKRVYDKDNGIYVWIDPVTREQTGEGIFDVFSKIGSKIASAGAKKLVKETAKKVATSAIDSGAKALGQYAGQKVVEKITKPKEPKEPKEPATPKPVSPGQFIKETMKKQKPDEILSILGKGVDKRILKLIKTNV